MPIEEAAAAGRLRRRFPGAAAAAVILLVFGSCGGEHASAPDRAAGSALPAPPSSLVRIDPPAAEGAMAPNLAVSGDDVLMTWLEPLPAATAAASPAAAGGAATRKSHALRFARLAQGAWSAPVTIASGEDFFANWADFPSVAASPGGGLLAHWLQKSGRSTYAYDVRLARSLDGGATWAAIGKLHDDAVKTEHGFVSILPEGEGFRAFWLDGREMSEAAGHGEGGGAGAHGSGAMTLRTAFVGEAAGPSELLDGRVCDCCQTSAARTAGGPIVVYRDRSASEVRDISIVRRAPGGWSEPAPVHGDGWEVPGCPVNGPSAAAEGALVAVAWHTAEGNKPRVLAAFSRDGGAAFGEPILVDGDGPPGRVGVLLDATGEAIVVWLAAEGEGAALRARRVAADGRMGDSLTIAAATRARAGGVPRAVRSGAAALVAWVEAGEPSRIRAAALALSGVPPPRPIATGAAPG